MGAGSTAVVCGKRVGGELRVTAGSTAVACGRQLAVSKVGAVIAVGGWVDGERVCGLQRSAVIGVGMWWYASPVGGGSGGHGTGARVVAVCIGGWQVGACPTSALVRTGQAGFLSQGLGVIGAFQPPHNAGVGCLLRNSSLVILLSILTFKNILAF